MSLGRAFFVAGARAVVGSLWAIRDDETAALMGSFYRELGRGATLAAALRVARRERIQAGAPAEAWAGLVLLGNGEITVTSGKDRDRVIPVLLAVGVVLVAAALLGLRAARRRSSSPA